MATDTRTPTDAPAVRSVPPRPAQPMRTIDAAPTVLGTAGAGVALGMVFLGPFGALIGGLAGVLVGGAAMSAKSRGD